MSPECVRQTAHATEINACRFSGSGAIVATVSHCPGAMLAFHPMQPLMVRVFGAVQGSSDGTIRLWDTTMGKPKGTLRGVTDNQAVMCLDFKGGLVAGGANDSVVRIWDISTERIRVGRPVAVSNGLCLVLSVACCRLVWRAVDMSPWLLWWRGLCLLQTSLVGHTGRVYGVCLSPDNRQLISTGSDRSIKVWDLARGVCTL